MLMIPFAAAAAMLSMPNCVRITSPDMMVCADMSAATFERQARAMIERNDRQGDGLDHDDILLAELRERARRRGDALRSLARYDLNGDFSLDDAEIQRADEDASEAGRQSLFGRFDLNRDGRIDRTEMLDRPLDDGTLGRLALLNAQLALDPNRDGRLEADEFAALAFRVFRAIDLDHNGIASDAELTAERGRQREQARPANICAPAPPPAQPTAFAEAGLRGAYSFVTDRADDHEIRVLIERLERARFVLAPMTVNLGGFDTVFAFGPAALGSADAVSREFATACAIGAGTRIYLGHVRYNPAEQAGSIRVR